MIGARSFGDEIRDRDVAAGHGRHPDEAPDLDVLGRDPPLATAEARDAADPEHVRLDSLDVGAERDEEAAEILDVRLARGVADHGLAFRENSRHDRVLGRHDARLVEEDVLAAETARPHLVAAVQGDLDPELRKGVHVRVEPTPADHVAARRRHASPCRTRESSGPASRNDARIRRQSSSSSSDLCTDDGSTRTSFGARPLDLGSDVVEEREHRRHVSDPRHVRQLHRLAREHAGGEHGQDAVLVPGGPDAAAERLAALDHESLEVLLGREGQRHRQGHAGQAGTVDGRWS